MNYELLFKTENEICPTKIGLNGHKEYSWSKDIKEKIIQFWFQLVRPNNSVELTYLEKKLHEILIDLKINLNSFVFVIKSEARELLIYLYKMIGNTRDIYEGKGEYKLSYMMIKVWYDFFPQAAFFAFETFFKNSTNKPFGSWKDVKYFCNYCIESGLHKNHPLIINAIILITKQIEIDNKNYDLYFNNQNTYKLNLSLASKWIPREKSQKFGWIFDESARYYFSHYFSNVNNLIDVERAINKSKMDYRKIISKLNKYIDTIEIKQCNNDWESINCNRLTSNNLIKYSNSFLNIKKDGNINSYDKNRIHFSNTFYNYINTINENDINNKFLLKGKNININTFMQETISLLKINPSSKTYKYKYDLINNLWQSLVNKTPNLKNLLPMIDVSNKINNSNFIGIGLGILISEKSNFGNGIIVFGSRALWINLNDCKTFVDKVQKIMKDINDIKFIDCNFYYGINMIHDVIVENKNHLNEFDDLTIVILSDFQLNNDIFETDTIYENIKKKFEETKIKKPHLVFWNLNITEGFPCKYFNHNVQMISGYNFSSLNYFKEENIFDNNVNYNSINTFSNNYHSWTLFTKILDNYRYYHLSSYMQNFL